MKLFKNDKKLNKRKNDISSLSNTINILNENELYESNEDVVIKKPTFSVKLTSLKNIITNKNDIKHHNFIDVNSNEKILNKLINKDEIDKCFWEYDKIPDIWVSVLIPCYNTKRKYIKECLDSIKNQVGNFGIELVWINDCSSEENTDIQLELLKELETLNNFKLNYNRTKINRGISFCLHEGLLICANEIIIRMDSDDIMVNNRIKTQLNYMTNNPFSVMCGSNMICFQEVNGNKREVSRTNHKKVLTWNEYKLNPVDWILNHPTLCFRRTCVLKAGNYRRNLKEPFEDLDFELRVLKMYGSLHNISECLLLYRTHEEQTSIKLGGNSLKNKLKEHFIKQIITN